MFFSNYIIAHFLHLMILTGHFHYITYHACIYAYYHYRFLIKISYLHSVVTIR